MQSAHRLVCGHAKACNDSCQSSGHPCGCPSLQRRYSVVKVESSDMYERGRPKAGGLNDLALGTMDRQERCTTDSANAQVPLRSACAEAMHAHLACVCLALHTLHDGGCQAGR
jgi:hypothetical protein